jgi:hypothetical protein
LSGFGVLISEAKIMEGYWIDSAMTGKGRVIHANGDVYSGDLTNSVYNGHGTMVYGDTARYSGEW